MRLTGKALGRHVLAIGGSGVGKSRWCESCAMQLILQGQGVAVLDPHGELFHNLIARIAATGDRGLWERMVILEPLDPQYTLGLNPLELLKEDVLERKAQEVAGVVNAIWGVSPLIAARMQRLMLHSFWLLAAAGLTLLELPELLTNADFRQSLMALHPETSPLRRYWEGEFPKQPRMMVEWTQSTLNKAGSLVIDPDLRLLFGQIQSTISLRQIMDERLVLLVNLSKGRLVADNSYLLGAFVMTEIKNAAMSRARNPTRQYPRFTVFVDEFQNFLTENVAEILSESRKYKLSLVLLHQFYDQLRERPELQQAVLNTVGNLVCFRLGDADAQRFVRDVFQPPIEQVKDHRTRYQKVPSLFFGEVNQRFDDPVYRELNEIWEYETRRLTALADREFWYKRRGPYRPRLFRSLDMPDVKLTPRLREQIAELKMISATRWARPKAQIRREIDVRIRIRIERTSKRPRRPVVETRTLHLEDQNEPEEVPVFTIDHD